MIFKRPVYHRNRKKVSLLYIHGEHKFENAVCWQNTSLSSPDNNKFLVPCYQKRNLDQDRDLLHISIVGPYPLCHTQTTFEYAASVSRHTRSRQHYKEIVLLEWGHLLSAHGWKQLLFWNCDFGIRIRGIIHIATTLVLRVISANEECKQSKHNSEMYVS